MDRGQGPGATERRANSIAGTEYVAAPDSGLDASLLDPRQTPPCPHLATEYFNKTLQRYAFTLPYFRPDAVANVIDMFEVESAFVGARDRLLNTLPRRR